MNTSYAHIINAFDYIAHNFSRKSSFFRHGNIAGSCCHDGDGPVAIIIMGVLTLIHHTGQFVVLYVRELRHQPVIHGFIGPRADDVVVLLHEQCQYLHRLVNRLAGTVDNFRKTTAFFSLQINIGKSHIFY